MAFKRITTMPLQSRFLSQLDLLSERLLSVCKATGGAEQKAERHSCHDDCKNFLTLNCLTIKWICIALGQ